MATAITLSALFVQPLVLFIILFDSVIVYIDLFFRRFCTSVATGWDCHWRSCWATHSIFVSQPANVRPAIRRVGSERCQCARIGCQHQHVPGAVFGFFRSVWALRNQRKKEINLKTIIYCFKFLQKSKINSTEFEVEIVPFLGPR